MHGDEALDRPGGYSRHGLLTPLKHRDFRLLWTGMTISLLGDGIFLVAVAWQTYELSNVPTALSLVGVAMSVPHITLLLFGGVISDRFPRRRVMLAADLVRGGAMLSLALLGITGNLELLHLTLLAAVYGAGTAFFGPAFDAIIPDIVPPSLFAQANALDQLVKPLALRMMGPAVGGWIVGWWGAAPAFALNAGTFLASAIALRLMRVSVVHHSDAEDDASMWVEMRRGFAFVRAHVWLWGTFAAATLSYLLFMGPADVLVPYLVKNGLRGSAGDLGLVFAIGGMGAIGAALLIGRLGIPKRAITFMYLTWTVATLSIALYGVARATWHLMAASFLFHSLEGAGTIAWVTTKQRLVPVALLGRVSSLDWLISTALLPVSFALTGPVSSLIGSRETLIGAGVLGTILTFAALYLPGMRAPERTAAAASAGGDGDLASARA
jgi:MFS family permease